MCVLPLDGRIAANWEASWLRQKLSRVLWVPIVGESGVPPGERIIGTPLVWSPDLDELATLRADWEELTGLVAAGALWEIDARRGSALQIRPKAANAADLVWVLDDAGEWVRENPRGFYLRARFTAAMLTRSFLLPDG